MGSSYTIKECIKCSAPLNQIGDELVCEYCGTRYDLPENYRQREKQPDLPKPEPVITPQQPSTSVKRGKAGKSSACGVVLIVLFALGVGGAILIWILSSLFSASQPETVSEERQFQAEVFGRDSSALPDKNPSDFIFRSNFYLGAVLNRSDNEDFHFSVYFKNRTDTVIDGNSKTNNLLVDSVSVSDNNGKRYTCEFSSDVRTTETVEPGEVTYLSSISCEDGLTPEVKYMNLDLQTAHWGAFDFQISVLPAQDRLQIRYNLWRYTDKFGLDITFYSKPPQHISVYFDDITVVDSMGNVYVPNYTGDFWDGDMVFFTGLIQNYSHGKDMMLQFDQPFPDEANSVTVNITINGQTISTTAPVDTMEGDLFFTREPIKTSND